jgi:hypothetical protein
MAIGYSILSAMKIIGVKISEEMKICNGYHLAKQ